MKSLIAISVFWLWMCIGAAPLAGQQTSTAPESETSANPAVEDVTATIAGGAEDTADDASSLAGSASAPDAEEHPESPAIVDGEERTDLNLLGQVQVKEGESRRNENVQIDLIDNNVLKDLNLRVGVTATLVQEFDPARRYFGAEFGNAPSAPVHLTQGVRRGVHGSLFEFHQNSAVSARSFFQVGGVKPARENNYGFQIGAPLWSGAALSLDGSQTRNRGSVNGNVLVPTLEERVPLASDPATRRMVQRILDLYPAELPNRTDISERMLNTNAPQYIDNDIGAATLDQTIGTKDRLTARYQYTSQRVDAFQLVAGQNPNTRTKAHDGRLTWVRTVSPVTVVEATTAFDRVHSLLTADDSAFGPTVLTSDVIQNLGPGSNIPIDRAVNQFRNGVRLRHTRGRHNWTAGGELIRRQLNGFEADTHRGQFSFRGDYGRNAITNIRLGTPSSYIESIGNVHRGFRSLEGQLFVGDRWQAAPDLTLTIGLRYEPVGAPYEVDGLNEIPYGCDCNNFAPQFGFAWRTGDRTGVLRGSYSLSYGEVFAATYGQVRQNAPLNIRTRVDAPALVNPLGGLDLANIAETRSTLYSLAPDLVMPYSHMYNLSWQTTLGEKWKLETGYVGSRTMKLLSEWYMNRAQVVPGLPQVTGTVSARRPDARYHDIRSVLNGSTAYYDAAKATLILPRWRTLTLEASYWFSKAIDLGANYLSTASGKDAKDGRGQYEFDVFNDMKSVSGFHQPHAMVWKASWQSPVFSSASWWNHLLGRWEISSVLLLKSGTPFTVNTGSDGPGFGNVDGSGSDRPDIVDPSILGRVIDHPDTSQSLLPASAFAFPGPTEPRGNIGRNTFRKDAIQNLNGAISRTWPVRGDSTLTFRAESINLTNHAQFAEPGTELANSNFGQITNTLNEGRTFRFLLRLSF